MILDGIVSLGAKVLDRVIPDPAQRDAAKLELMKQAAAGELQEWQLELQATQQQVDLLKVDAASGDKFQARWRPAIGYICGASLAMSFPVWQLAAMVQALCQGRPIPRPDMGELMPVLIALLGLGAMRTYEKVGKVAR